MKHTLILLLSFLASKSGTCQEKGLVDLMKDTTRLYVSYSYYLDYTSDSTFGNRKTSDLFLGKSGYVSVTQLQKMDDYLKQALKDNPNMPKEMVEYIKLSDQISRALNTVIVRHYNSPAYYKYGFSNNKDVLVEDSALFDWQVTNEKKSILGINCQKAIGNRQGTTITAWFAESIPVNAGPAFITGCPGLILEYTNPKARIHYMANKITSTSIPSDHFRKLYSAQILTKVEYQKTMVGEQERMMRLEKMIKSGKFNSTEGN